MCVVNSQHTSDHESRTTSRTGSWSGPGRLGGAGPRRRELARGAGLALFAQPQQPGAHARAELRRAEGLRDVVDRAGGEPLLHLERLVEPRDEDDPQGPVGGVLAQAVADLVAAALG